MPGGAEWLIIVGVIVLLFVPGLAAFGLGYFVGQKSARTPEPPGAAASGPGPDTPAPADASVDTGGSGDDDE
jgi:hypothetical protein